MPYQVIHRYTDTPKNAGEESKGFLSRENYADDLFDDAGLESNHVNFGFYPVMLRTTLTTPLVLAFPPSTTLIAHQ